MLEIGSTGRMFDVIDSSGVLHHFLPIRFPGWKSLLPAVRPGGLMRIGLYSERGRAGIVAARKFIGEHGFAATAGDIRRGRQRCWMRIIRHS